jgi:crotonobetaine/carnitine-CoA ligase
MTPADHLLQFQGLNLARLLLDRAQRRGDHPLLVWAPHDGEADVWTYRRFADKVARVAGGLAARGVRPGDRVLVQLENCPEFLLVLFACAHLGAVCVPVNAMAAGQEVAYLADAVQAVGAVTQPSLAGALAAHATGLRWIVATDHDGGRPAETPAGVDPADRFERLDAEPIAAAAHDPAAPLLVMFTSGTTSRPKGVAWTHANALWSARLGAQQQGLVASDVFQVFLPLFHVVGLSWSVLPALWAGATVVLQPKFSASRFWPVAVRHRCTVASQVIFTANVLMEQPVPAHCFRQWCNALWLPEQAQRFGLSVLSAWGMTELVAQGIVGDPAMPPPRGAIGRPSVGYGVRVENDRGDPAAPGEIGRLLVKGVAGVSLFAGYWGDEQATREAFDDRGYFVTGDMVTLEADGSIRFSDRRKDLIKVGGEGVSAAEIERVIRAVPDVAEVAVVARPDPLYGEVPVAFVRAAQEDSTGLPEAVLAACRAGLGKFKVPRDVKVVPDLPRIGVGKVSKAELRKWAAEGGPP